MVARSETPVKKSRIQEKEKVFESKRMFEKSKKEKGKGEKGTFSQFQCIERSEATWEGLSKPKASAKGEGL